MSESVRSASSYRVSNLSDITYIEQSLHPIEPKGSQEPKAFDTTSATCPETSLASALCGNLIITDEKWAKVEAVTGVQLANPLKAKLIQGFDVDSVSAWPPIIWETINRIPKLARKRAFQHCTIDPLDNYEDFAWMGDACIRSALTLILYDQLNEKHLAFRDTIRAACLKRTTLNAICRGLGMDKHIQMRQQVSDRVCEDVFGAVAGAINTTLGHETLRTYIEAIYNPMITTLRLQLEESGWEEASLLSWAGRRGNALPASLDYLENFKELCENEKWSFQVEDLNEVQKTTPRSEIWTQHVIVESERSTGSGRNKRMARNNAAEKLYRRLTGQEGVGSSSSAEVAPDHPVPGMTVTGVSNAEADREPTAARTKRPRADKDDDAPPARLPKHGRYGD